MGDTGSDSRNLVPLVSKEILLALAVGIVEEHALVHQGPVLVVAATG